MRWLNVFRVEYKMRGFRPTDDMVEGNFVCEYPLTTYSAEVTSIVEWWVFFFPFLDELEPFMCLISYRSNTVIVHPGSLILSLASSALPP